MAMPDLREAYAAQAATRALGDHWSGPVAMVDRLVRLTGVRPDHMVLDVGCGVGGPARRLAEVAGARVVGVDLVVPVLAEACRRTDRPEVAFLAGAADALPVAGRSVDHVWALGVVAHLREVDGFAREAARVLRPGGTMALTEAFWDGRRPPRFERPAPAPWHRVTSEEAAAALGASGFLEVRVQPWPGDGLPGALDASDPLLRRDLEDGRLVPALVTGRGPGP
jgi:SAM-dependent methyltransferase